jgi:hypothetical protein
MCFVTCLLATTRFELVAVLDTIDDLLGPLFMDGHAILDNALILRQHGMKGLLHTTKL